jgi:glycerate kinase
VDKLSKAGIPDAGQLAEHSGAGSAGGLGFACLLLEATQVSGADYFLDLLDFNTRKYGCDVVITGTGTPPGTPGCPSHCCAGSGTT